jgi:predicted ATPase
MQPISPAKQTAPWSTLKKAAHDGRVTVVTTSSPILQFASRADLRVLKPPQ